MTVRPHQMPSVSSGNQSSHDDPQDVILENMSQGIAVWDSELQLVAFNQRYVELMQFPPEFIQPGISYPTVVRHLAERGEFGPIPDMDAHIQSRIAIARQSGAQRHERTLPNGRVLEAQRRPMPGGGFVSTFTDVTEIKRAEEEVERKSTLLSATLNVMNQGLVIYDSEQKLQLFNEAYLRLFGFPPGFINLGMTYEQVLSYLLTQQEILSREALSQAIHRRTEGARKGESHRNLHRRKNGTCISVNRVPLPDGGFVITFADVTTELNATDEVGKTSALLKATQDNMLQGICVYDKEFRIININRRFLELYDLPEKIAHIGANFRGIVAFRAERGDYGPGDPK